MQILKSQPAQSRRDFLRAGMYAVGVSTGLPALFQQISQVEAAGALNGAAEKNPNRILVVLELSGGNDGLNTVVPHGDDIYYKMRPNLGIPKDQVLKIDEYFGIHPGCEGLYKLFKDGKVATINACGYPNPNLSHFTAMEWWHTATPHGSDKNGWLGRFADSHRPDAPENYIVNISSQQSRAIASDKHSPVVFKDPRKFGRIGTSAQQKVFETFGKLYPTSNPTLEFVNTVSRTATVGAAQVRNACSEYRTLVDYGSENDLTRDLKKVTAMIAAQLPTRIYYVSLGGFDHHAAQLNAHNLLMMYVGDAMRGFMEDIQRIGRSDDVVMMVFTEFGRRVQENASAGTDHGTATPMFLIGDPVKGGFYGNRADLADLDDGNLKMNTDFRSVYGTVLKDWMGFSGTEVVLKGNYPSVDGVFG